jgi:type II secretory pathway pseudopilin PulG
MSHKIHKSQAGIAVIVVVIAVAVIGSGIALSYSRVKESRDNKVALEQQQAADQKVAQSLAKKAEQSKEAPKTTKVQPVPQPASSPATSPAPAPAPTPQPQAKPAISHPSQANCKANDGTFIVYGSTQGSAPTYYDAERTSKSSTTIAYGSAIEVHCFSNSIQKLVYNDFFVAPESVSITKQ